MSAPRPAPLGRFREGHADRGFTLVELLIAVVLSGVIAGVTTAILITSLNVANTTTDAVRNSTDSGLISAFLYRDAQSAGAVDPATAQLHDDLGVSTDDSVAGWGGCTQLDSAGLPASLVVRFSWTDPGSAATPSDVVVTYALDEGLDQLTRRVCSGGTDVDVVLGNSVSAATASCEPATVPTCDGRPTTVTLQLTGSGATATDTTLTASLRGDTQAPPDATNSSQIALLALGNRAASPPAPCPNLKLNGTGAITVIGDVLVDGSCGAAPIVGDATTLQPTGATGSITGIADPFRAQQFPSPTCAGSNPDPIGASPGPGAVIVYPDPVSIVTAVELQPGQHVFCAGLDIGAGGRVTGTDVLLYFDGGTLTVDADAAVDLTPPATGPYANRLIWVASPQTITLDGGPRVNSFRGFIYAPTSSLHLSSTLAANIGGLIVMDLTVEGPGAARIGLPMPVSTISPTSTPGGQVGIAYAVTLTTSGGVSPTTWTATGLPPGLSIASVDGSTASISGTPTTSGSFGITVTTFDASAAAASTDYTITITPQLAISGPTSMPSGQVGVAYPPITMTTSGGTPAMAWSATGLPAGMAIDASSGVISGEPTMSGSYVVVVYVTDSMAATATIDYTIAVSPLLTVAGPETLPDGQVGTAYVPTTLTSSGGTSPHSWSTTGLPPGLSIDASTGEVTGTPSVSGSFDVTADVTDAIGAVATRDFVLIVAPPAIMLTVSGPATLPPGVVGSGYPTTTVSAAGGVGPYTWSATGLPPGLAIDATTGAIDGSPSTAGSFDIAVTVIDAVTASAQMAYTVTVGPPVVVPPGCPATTTGWRGEYYANRTLAGASTLCRDDASVNFDWAGGAPATGLPADNFSVRWTRTQDFAADSYTFTVGSDDGGRLYIDGVLVLDRWVDQAYPASVPTVVRSLTAGSHTIVMEYYERGGQARATLSWFAGSPPLPPSCTVAAAGWLGQYYGNIALAGTPVQCRDDASVNFDWVGGAPLAGLPADNFSVRWTRTQDFAAGTYTFVLGTDDGGRLYIDGVLVLDRWIDQAYPATPPSTVRTMVAGSHTIVVEYYERGGLARATLGWS